MKKLSLLVSLVLVLALTQAALAQTTAKNVIFMVPDGMGLSDVTAARIYMGGVDGANLSFENLPQIGYQRTHSANSVVTDSAAAASAWACGEKFTNGEICQHGEGGTYPQSIVDLAEAAGKTIGLVATSTITHATPAAFGSHIHYRKCETEIAKQYVERGIDLMLGGGTGTFQKLDSTDSCGTGGDYIAAAQTAGYAYATTKTEMNTAVTAENTKLLGLFNTDGLTAVSQREWVNGQPTTDEPLLQDMTTAALNFMELHGTEPGFFLLIEGSQIDWENHANDYYGQLAEMVDFHYSVQRVMNWLDANPTVKAETLLIVVADHETGGHTIAGPDASSYVDEFRYPEGTTHADYQAPGSVVINRWTTTGHSAVDTIIYSQGPGSENLGGAVQNTAIYGVIKNAMGL